MLMDTILSYFEGNCKYQLLNLHIISVDKNLTVFNSKTNYMVAKYGMYFSTLSVFFDKI